MSLARLVPAVLLLALVVPAPGAASRAPCVEYTPPSDVDVALDSCAFTYCKDVKAASACASRTSNGELEVEVCARPVGCRFLLVYNGPRLPVDTGILA
ncbi:MAG TPA: hypothetical protein VI997_09890 [Candidatus Thermoplasmatota archaeon]|nr:hypothetical protein [Candidatus Thermoplasmatota archaeon]